MGTCIPSQYRRSTCTTHFRRFAARIWYGQSTRLFPPPGSALVGVFVFTLKCDSRMAAGEVPASEADLTRYREGVEPLPHTSFISPWPELVSYPVPGQTSGADVTLRPTSPHLGAGGGGGAASFHWGTWLHGVRGEAWTKQIWLRKNQGNWCWVGKTLFLPPELLAHGEKFIVSLAYCVLHAYHGLCIFLK